MSRSWNGSAKPSSRAALSPAPVNRLLPSGPPSPQVVALEGALRIQLPVAQSRLTAVGYHASGDGAVALQPLAALRTLELGSLDVNGSVRPLFSGEYVGIDHQHGPGVDNVMDANALAFEDASFDVVVSTSMLEHDPAFWRTLPEVARVLRPGGHFILTTVTTGFPVHNEPDYWRFLPNTWNLLMELAGCAMLECRDDPQSGGPQLTGRRL